MEWENWFGDSGHITKLNNARRENILNSSFYKRPWGPTRGKPRKAEGVADPQLKKKKERKIRK